ncbi:gamma-glutamyl hydrolase-like [Calliopsis andreniformis]|uniref:gamma-glutamyl hydrolase-like n=1 Tax=Calliopsis andreniformis TaxID=337506 RepID=UPI003FCCFE2D
MVSIAVVVTLFVAASLHFTACQLNSNNRPIIGILTQEVTNYVNGQLHPDHYDSYIAASYVKFIEGAGGRVVPIWIDKPKSYYEDILSKINGVLWPGGAADITRKGGYADAAYKIYKIAKRMNDQDIYFPIFGICLGFELLTYITANRQMTLIPCNSEGQTIPLEFTPEYRNSSMFQNATPEFIHMLSSYNITANFHHFCVTQKMLRTTGVLDQFRIMSYNHDVNGVKFISSLENIEYPFYGLQFHPEKNLYEWIIGKHIPHSERAVVAAQYFANFFVSEARKNFNSFQSEREEMRHLIYNYTPIYTGSKNILFQQCYMFKKKNE